MSTFMKNQRFMKKCNVCMHAGKSEEIYISHSTKDTKGNVICPTLLAQKCSSCKETGHTPMYCSLTKTHKKEDKRREHVDKIAVQELKKQQTKKKDREAKNYFAGLLDFDDESEEEDDQETTAIKLSLAPKVIIPQKKTGKDFVNAVNSKGGQEKKEDREMVIKLPTIIIPSLLGEQEKKKAILWGDMEDSDDEY
jgi:hypothetical protein